MGSHVNFPNQHWCVFNRSPTEDVLREGESESNGNLSTPVSASQPSEFSGTRTLSLRGSRSLLPVSPSVEDSDLVTSRLDQEQGIRISSLC